MSGVGAFTGTERSQTFLYCGRLDFGANDSYCYLVVIFISLVISVEVSRVPSLTVIGMNFVPVHLVVSAGILKNTDELVPSGIYLYQASH